MGRKRTSVKRTKRGATKSVRRSRQLIFVFLGGAVVLLFAAIGFGSLNNIGSQKFCANSISCIKDLSGKFDPKGKEAEYGGRAVSVPSQKALSYVNPAKNVLGETTGTKTITVDLSSQHLYAYEGDRVVMDFPVSTGKWGRTPTGTFHIWVKLRFTRMSGGSGSDYYNLPNVPYTMFYSGDGVPASAGYSIHGAYWHNNFGHPMSHGCVNMRIADAGQIFAWADPLTDGSTTHATKDNPGTEIVVYGTTPTE